MQTAEIIVTLEKAIEQDWPVVARAAIERLQELETIVAWHEERFQAARDAWDMLTAMTREDERVKAHQLLLDAISGVRFVKPDAETMEWARKVVEKLEHGRGHPDD
jgi:uncharacterized protein (DUF1697 family)